MRQSLSYLKAKTMLWPSVYPHYLTYGPRAHSASVSQVGIKNDHGNVWGGGGTAVIKSENLYGTSRIVYTAMKSGCILSSSCQLLSITSPNDYYSNALAHQVRFYYNFYLASLRLRVITFRALGLR